MNACERLSEMSEVSSGMYTVGRIAVLASLPSAELASALTAAGFSCVGAVEGDTSSCYEWRLTDTVPVEQLLPLQSFTPEVEHLGCYNCG